jgi:hypothetical protein
VRIDKLTKDSSNRKNFFRGALSAGDRTLHRSHELWMGGFSRKE